MLAGALYALAAAMDLTTTSVALHLGLREGNPVVAPMLNAYGILPQVALSAILCAVLLWYAKRGGAPLVYGLAALRWVVVLSNLFQLAWANHALALNVIHFAH